MNNLVRSLVIVVLGSAAITAPAAAMRKCMAPGAALIIVDGQVLGEHVETPPTESGRIQWHLSNGKVVDLPTPDIESIYVNCLLQPDGASGELVQRTVVAIVTRSGAPEMMRRYLTELVTAQQAYRAKEGRYAADLAELGFFATRAPLPISMTVEEGGWSASSG